VLLAPGTQERTFSVRTTNVALRKVMGGASPFAVPACCDQPVVSDYPGCNAAAAARTTLRVSCSRTGTFNRVTCQ
jgi:hypothetical protein